MNKNIRKTACLISVVICTRNRVDLLRDAIQSVCDQEYASENFEIIVVDNGSVDDTATLVQGFCDTYSFVRYVMEPKLGLSHARNRGWQEARGEYVAYLDDDAKASPQWLKVASLVIQDASPAALGGPYKSFHKTVHPVWFKEQYGSRSMADQPGPLNNFLSGGNFFVRRDILSHLGGFDPTLGMAGNRVAYAEEVHLQRRICEEIPGAVVYYHPDILIYHLVRAEKYDLKWRLTSSFASGRDLYFSKLKRKRPVSQMVFTAKVLLEFFDVVFGFLVRNRKQYPFWQNYVYERVGKWFAKLGYSYAPWTHIIKSARQ